MEAIKYEKKKRKTVLEPCNREETMIENVKLGKGSAMSRPSRQKRFICDEL